MSTPLSTSGSEFSPPSDEPPDVQELLVFLPDYIRMPTRHLDHCGCYLPVLTRFVMMTSDTPPIYTSFIAGIQPLSDDRIIIVIMLYQRNVLYHLHVNDNRLLLLGNLIVIMVMMYDLALCLRWILFLAEKTRHPSLKE